MAKTKAELKQTHPTYDTFIGEWEFFIRSYMGGKMYRDGDYLVKHPFESDKNYERRKQISYFYNYCEPIVDTYSSHLYKGKINRDYGSLTDNPLFDSYLKDSDLEGKSYEQFMRETQRLRSSYGLIYILVDMPTVTAETMADAQDNDIRPYNVIVTPENLIDWSYVREANGRRILDMVKIKSVITQDITEYIIWTRDVWEKYHLDSSRDNDGVILIDSGDNPIGRVPLVIGYNKKTNIDNWGASDINDIADVNKNIYYLCSDAKEIIENTAFPMLAVPDKDLGQDNSGTDVGSGQLIGFNEESGKPYWLEAPHSSLAEIREWIEQDITEIHRIAKMGGIRAMQDSSQVASGVALEIESQNFQAVLNEKADNMEETEIQVLELWALWMGIEFDGEIDYPEDFSFRDVQRDLENAIRAITTNINSKTFKQELDKKNARLILPKADDDTLAIIDSEIVTDPVTTTTTELEEALGEPIEAEDGNEGS